MNQHNMKKLETHSQRNTQRYCILSYSASVDWQAICMWAQSQRGGNDCPKPKGRSQTQIFTRGHFWLLLVATFVSDLPTVLWARNSDHNGGVVASRQGKAWEMCSLSDKVLKRHCRLIESALCFMERGLWV